MPNQQVAVAAAGLPNADPLQPTLWSAQHRRTGRVVHVLAADREAVSYRFDDDGECVLRRIDAVDYLDRYQARPTELRMGTKRAAEVWSAVHRKTGQRILITAATSKRVSFRFEADRGGSIYHLSLSTYEENYRPEHIDTPARVIHVAAPVPVPPPVAEVWSGEEAERECRAAETICEAVEKAFGPEPGERPAIPVAGSARCAAMYLVSTMCAIPVFQVAEAFRVETAVADRIIRRIILLRSKSRRADILLRRMERGLMRWIKDGRP